eukprot:jgi/Chrzof1/8746/Cz03g23010.t1
MTGVQDPNIDYERRQSGFMLGSGSIGVHSTRTCRSLTRADVRGEAEQADRQTYETASKLTVTAPHSL